MGNQNRFGYVANVQVNHNSGAPEFTEIVKHDLQTGTNLVRQYGPDRFGGEALFVPRSNNSSSNQSAQAVDEDDGWLLSHVFDAKSESSELLVIDAKTIDAEPDSHNSLATTRTLRISWHVDSSQRIHLISGRHGPLRHGFGTCA